MKDIGTVVWSKQKRVLPLILLSVVPCITEGCRPQADDPASAGLASHFPGESRERRQGDSDPAGRGESLSFPEMVYVEGGSFEMGDVFDESRKNERPVHEVTLAGFHLGRYEVTVAEFGHFVEETGYATTAERDGSAPLWLRKSIWPWRSWEYKSGASWRKPYLEQTGRHPVVQVSWYDAIAYCNWLSERAGLSPAYEQETGKLLNSNGIVTTDPMMALGYRLPTEAEWEFAARERGRWVRFGTGAMVAKASEINFDASRSSACRCSEEGERRGGTTPVGSFEPNHLGLYDMSGNVWEWCGDAYIDYSAERQTNPYVAMGTRRVTRGGRWGGDAWDARVFTRYSWSPSAMCNNTGFRLAKSSKVSEEG